MKFGDKLIKISKGKYEDFYIDYGFLEDFVKDYNVSFELFKDAVDIELKNLMRLFAQCRRILHSQNANC